MLRTAKRRLLDLCRILRLPSLVLASRWRARRLAILCYHGIALDDEHRWNPRLYTSEARLRARLARLRALGCAVVPLGEGIERLRAGTLPERAVALTFDDGFFDFYRLAWPLVRDHAWPVTLYLSTYYTRHPDWPVFDLMSGYLLWKSVRARLRWPGVLPAPVALDAPGRLAAEQALKRYCRLHGLSGADKHGLLGELAERVDVDLASLGAQRLLHLMSGEEVRRVAAEGVDVQLHTHRHRVFRGRARFCRELDENREEIVRLTGREPRHFCYPSGLHLGTFPAWLRESGVQTAVTCDPGLAGHDSEPLRLPRFLDCEAVSEPEFDARVSGLSHFLPRRRHPPGTYALRDDADEPVPVAPAV